MHTKKILPKTCDVQLEPEATLSTVLQACFVAHGLTHKGTSTTLARLYDWEHIEVTKASDIEPAHTYFIDFIDQEIALQCWRQYTASMSDQQADELCEEQSIRLDEDELLSESSESYGSDDDGQSHHSTLSNSVLRNDYSVLMLGDKDSGKSALVARFLDKEFFLAKHIDTVIDKHQQLMFMLNSQGLKDRQVTLNIKDVGKRFVQDHMYETQDAFIVCFSITSQEQFHYATQVCQKIKQQSKRPIVLVGSKCDHDERRQVSYIDAEKVAESIDATYLESSALTPYNVEEVFDRALLQIFKQEKVIRDAKKALKQTIVSKAEVSKPGEEDPCCCTIF